MTAAFAATAIAVIGLANIGSGIFAGICGDRFRKKYILSGFYICRAIVMTGFLLIPITETTALVFAVLIGLLWLGTVPITSALVAQIFGVRYLSTLFGFVFFSHQLGAFLGSWLGGYVFDLTGSYDIVWGVAVVLGLVAAAFHLPIADAPVTRLQENAA